MWENGAKYGSNSIIFFLDRERELIKSKPLTQHTTYTHIYTLAYSSFTPQIYRSCTYTCMCVCVCTYNTSNLPQTILGFPFINWPSPTILNVIFYTLPFSLFLSPFLFSYKKKQWEKVMVNSFKKATALINNQKLFFWWG